MESRNFKYRTKKVTKEILVINRRMPLCIITFLSIFVFSCTNKVASTIKGGWSIDEIKVNGNSYINCLSINTVFFDNENIRFNKIPIGLNPLCDSEICLSGKYRLVFTNKKIESLIVYCDSIKMKEIYNVLFFRDRQNKLLKMKLLSDNIEIIFTKGLFNYDTNINLIEFLEKISNKM